VYFIALVALVGLINMTINALNDYDKRKGENSEAR
jgi:1,4-dihydroxy-2-naphthoate octaprenyltransferase